MLGFIFEGAWNAGTFGREKDRYAIEVGQRHVYPWRFTNIWTGEMRPMRHTPKRNEGDGGDD